MRKATHRAGRRAALEGGALIAITPSPALEGAIAALRGAALLRQVASIYGIRPGLMVTCALFRRVVWTAASVSGLELLFQPLADGNLYYNMPFLKHLLAAIPGAGVGAVPDFIGWRTSPRRRVLRCYPTATTFRCRSSNPACGAFTRRQKPRVL